MSDVDLSLQAELPWDELHRRRTEELLAHYNKQVKCYEERSKTRAVTKKEIERLCEVSEGQRLELVEAAKAVDLARAALEKQLYKPDPR